MNKFTVPKKYKDDFKRSLDCAVELGSFSDKTLADELGVSKLNAAIFIGFMVKYEFLFPSSKNEVKTVRLTPDEWEALGRDIDAYVPEPIKEESVFSLTPREKIVIGKNSVEILADGAMIVSGKNSMFIPAEELTLPHLKKAGFLKKGFIFFGNPCPKNARQAKKSPAAIVFSRAWNDTFDTFHANLLADLEKRA